VSNWFLFSIFVLNKWGSTKHNHAELCVTVLL
jgi:hypothetical protein